MRLDADETAVDAATRLRVGGALLDADGSPGEGADFTVGHGPEKLPSAYLRELNEQGWVSLTCVLSPAVVDGLRQVGCVDVYEGRERSREARLAQHPAVAKVTAEPISLWLTREYMCTPDIRLGHSPGISALSRDDGQREVQGWHTDFPYLWGTGDRIPVPSGDLVLGMQRNVCVSDFRKDNGATLFKLGSHASNAPPPKAWGISTQTYRKGYRAKHGLPYGGPDADVIEAPAGTIVLYDARTWHRAGINSTDRLRGAMIQAMVPGFIIPFMDTSATLKAFHKSDAYDQVTERERKELDKLMIHKHHGPGRHVRHHHRRGTDGASARAARGGGFGLLNAQHCCGRGCAVAGGARRTRWTSCPASNKWLHRARHCESRSRVCKSDAGAGNVANLRSST